MFPKSINNNNGKDYTIATGGRTGNKSATKGRHSDDDDNDDDRLDDSLSTCKEMTEEFLHQPSPPTTTTTTTTTTISSCEKIAVAAVSTTNHPNDGDEEASCLSFESDEEPSPVASCTSTTATDASASASESPKTTEDDEAKVKEQEIPMDGKESSVPVVDELQETVTTSTTTIQDEESNVTAAVLIGEMNNQGPDKKKKAVSFSTVQVRSYLLIAGDNPAVSSGIPLSIDWEYEEYDVVEMDDYEDYKQQHSRTLAEFKTTALQRLDMLRRCRGYSRNELQPYIKSVNIARQRRQRTAERLPWQFLDERLERIQRAVFNATVRKRQKQKEREYLKSCGCVS